MEASHRYGHHTSLKPETRQIFEQLPSVRAFEKNCPIYFQGDGAQSFYYIKKGQIKVFMNSADGMEITLNVAGKGNIIGEAAFFDGLPRVSSAKAITKAEIVTINREMLLQLFTRHPDLAMEILSLQAKTIRMLSTQIDNMTFLQADVRIAKLLCESSEIIGGEYTVKLTHEEIGNIVGVTRVTVSKTLARFAKEGAISTKYRAIVIKDMEKLLELGAKTN